MVKLPKISIVTPSFNSERWIEETILSVTEQYYPNLEYIIIDGGSSDRTVDIIKKYEKRLAYWASERDNGMYDAINKGFAIATGDIFAWINSDDTYLPGTFSFVAEVFNRFPVYDWITGSTIYINESSAVESKHPVLLYNKKDLERGYHGLCMHFVQQPCCFWRTRLWRSFGPIPTSMRYAGDYWLWMQFSKAADLISVKRPVAAFRRHSSQLSRNHEAYFLEMRNASCTSIFQIWLRRSLRKISRGSDLDVKLLNILTFRKPYVWVDPADNFRVKNTRKTRIY